MAQESQPRRQTKTKTAVTDEVETLSPVEMSLGKSNGNSASRTRDYNPGSPVSLFWQHPISDQEEVNWFVPPLPRREEKHEEVNGLLSELCDHMKDTPMRAWLVRWNYATRSAAAAGEEVDVELEAEQRFAIQQERAEVECKKIDAMLSSLENREKETETELIAAQKSFAEASANAGLACNPDPKYLTSRFNEADLTDFYFAPSGINPQCVEDAVQAIVPDLDAVAGEQGVSPTQRHSLWSTILTYFMQFLAPLVCGFMLAICLGTLVGILDLDDFSRRDSFPKFALSAALGFVIVYLMGEIFSNAVHSLTRTLEERGEDGEQAPPPLPNTQSAYPPGRVTPEFTRSKSTPPTLRTGKRIAIGLIVVALCLGFAEVVAEGIGIRELHRQQMARRARFGGGGIGGHGEEELPILMYLLIGTLISGPYLFYKASKAWGESDLQLREAWLIHQQRAWVDYRRARPETQLAFQVACHVEQLEKSLYDIKMQIKRLHKNRVALENLEPDKHTQARRKEARAAAVGESLRLQNMIEEIVDTHEPFGKGQGYAAAYARPTTGYANSSSNFSGQTG